MSNVFSPDEGKLTKTVENQTAKVPSMVYLGAAVAAMGVSLGLKVEVKRRCLLASGPLHSY